jgi:hypothetical protein
MGDLSCQEIADDESHHVRQAASLKFGNGLRIIFKRARQDREENESGQEDHQRPEDAAKDAGAKTHPNLTGLSGGEHARDYRQQKPE